MSLQCSNFASVPFCRAYAVSALTYGMILIPLALLQWASEPNHQYVGRIPKILHRIFATASCAFLAGWVLNLTMTTNLEAFVGGLLIDVTTICLVCVMWIVGYGIILSLYRASNLFFPVFPRFFFGVIIVISILSIFVVNVLSFGFDSVWPRSYLYMWLAFTFASAMLILWYLTFQLVRIIGDEKAFILLRLRVMVGAMTCLTAIGVAFQVMDAIAVYDSQTTLQAHMQTDSGSLFSLIFLHLQGIGMAVGVWYGWIEIAICPGEEVPLYPDDHPAAPSVQSDGSMNRDPGPS